MFWNRKPVVPTGPSHSGWFEVFRCSHCLREMSEGTRLCRDCGCRDTIESIVCRYKWDGAIAFCSATHDKASLLPFLDDYTLERQEVFFGENYRYYYKNYRIEPWTHCTKDEK